MEKSNKNKYRNLRWQAFAVQSRKRNSIWNWEKSFDGGYPNPKELSVRGRILSWGKSLKIKDAIGGQ
jgi:predicted Rdx family selenoprotein